MEHETESGPQTALLTPHARLFELLRQTDFAEEICKRRAEAPYSKMTSEALRQAALTSLVRGAGRRT